MFACKLLTAHRSPYVLAKVSATVASRSRLGPITSDLWSQTLSSVLSFVWCPPVHENTRGLLSVCTLNTFAFGRCCWFSLLSTSHMFTSGRSWSLNAWVYVDMIWGDAGKHANDRRTSSTVGTRVSPSSTGGGDGMLSCACSTGCPDNDNVDDNDDDREVFGYIDNVNI